ncbi:MAG: hypothetical protein KKF44_02895 [Nanoarchaeota archaeon]|nr:hypothetical protein [Nanoarchaeota archaeon]
MDIDLTELGLTKYESMVYNALVKIGKSSSSKISAESNVPYGKIYTVLDSLERKCLVKVIPEKTKMFEPGDPANIRALLNSKINKLDNLSKDIEKLKQIYDTTEKENVFIAKGQRNFYRLQKQRKIAKKSNYLIKYTSEFHPIFVKGVQKAIKSGVDIKVLSRYDNENKDNIKKWIKITKNIKQVQNEGIGIDIVDEEETMIVLIKSNVSILIKDKPFTKLMKELFLNYYSNKEKVKL